MTHDHWLTGIWERRLSECRSALDADREYAWFYRVRIKILEYLIGRYRTSPESPPGPIMTGAPAIFLPPPSPRPLKSRERIRSLLEQIRA